ncbi:MAG: peptidoglycan D,D-transpeptidase FtsI family protein [Suipraeoptans sp.]
MNKRKFTIPMKRKLAIVFIIIMLGFLVLISRITYINASEGEQYTKYVLDQHQYNNQTISYKRGDILDRNGTKLATSERVYNVILDAKVLLSSERFKEPSLNAINECFDIAVEDVEKILEDNPNSRYIILRKDVPYETAIKFISMENDEENGVNINGVWLEDDYLRTYPYGNLASDLLGFVVDGNVGNSGLEAKYNSTLNGTNGREYGYRDEDSTFNRTVKEAIDGDNLVTTLDLQIQSIVERNIVSFNEEHAGEAREGQNGSTNMSVLVMNPNNGEVLAMASTPNYDLNNPRDLSGYITAEQEASMTSEELNDYRNSIWRNYCISDTFEPGSTFKTFVIAAALEEGVLSGDETFYCGGSTFVGGHTIGCAHGAVHGTQTLKQVLENSCNVALTEIASRIGIEKFVELQRNFGFGEYTGIDLPGEAMTSGLLYTIDNMTPIDLATNSFGQNFNVTMIQLCSSFCSVINGGDYYKPHVLKQVSDDDDVVMSETGSELLKKTISKETSDVMKDYLRGVVLEGTGIKGAVEGYSIGGKTGTAEKLPRGTGNYVVSFIGYAPQDNPQVVVYVVIDEPNVSDQSNSGLAASVSSSIMSEVLPYMGVKKDAE